MNNLTHLDFYYSYQEHPILITVSENARMLEYYHIKI